MDKYELSIKEDKIKKHAEKKDYETAAKIADTIDWSRIKNIKMLTLVSQVYEKIGNYAAAKDVLLCAYERVPVGRRMLYKLTELCVKAGNLDEAEEYFEEFQDIAPNDIGKLILAYQIEAARGESIDKLIMILELYRKNEFEEKWAYELAWLYHKAGRVKDCVRLCNEIILWFSVGPYVDRAMELKMQYEPLSPSQQEKLVNKKKFEERIKAVEREFEQKYEEEAAEEAEREEAAQESVMTQDAEEISEADEVSAQPEETEEVSVEEEAGPQLLFQTSQIHSIESELAQAIRAAAAAEDPEEEEFPAVDQPAEDPLGATREVTEEVRAAWNEPQASEAEVETEDGLEAEMSETVPAEEEIPEEAAAADELPEEEIKEEDLMREVSAAMAASVAEMTAEAENPEADTAEAEHSEELDAVEAEHSEEMDTAEETPEAPETAASSEAGEAAEVEAPAAGSETADPTEEDEMMKALSAAVEASLSAALAEEAAPGTGSETPEEAASAAEEPAEAEPEPAPEEDRIPEAQPAAEMSEPESVPEEDAFEDAPEEDLIPEEEAAEEEEKRITCVVVEAGGEDRIKVAVEKLKKTHEILGTQAAQAAKITALKLNEKGIKDTFARLGGRDLIIDRAARLSGEAAAELAEELQHPSVSMVLLLVDNPADIDALLDRTPALDENCVYLEEGTELSEDEFVDRIHQMAEEEECVIDEMASLAVYAAAERLKKSGKVLTEESAREMIDEVIDRAEHRGLKGIFGSKYDKNGYLILKEQHFKNL